MRFIKEEVRRIPEADRMVIVEYSAVDTQKGEERLLVGVIFPKDSDISNLLVNGIRGYMDTVLKITGLDCTEISETLTTQSTVTEN